MPSAFQPPTWSSETHKLQLINLPIKWIKAHIPKFYGSLPLNAWWKSGMPFLKKDIK